VKDCTLFGIDGGTPAKVIDTPGFMDSSGTDNNTLEAILDMLENIKDKGFHIGLFCFSATE
jgi:GTP1/Obg family GTP-binding protein